MDRWWYRDLVRRDGEVHEEAPTVENPLARTAAPRWAGAAEPIVAEALGLPRQDGYMQDWPLEVANGELLERTCDLYDHTTDDAVRFDVMALALTISR